MSEEKIEKKYVSKVRRYFDDPLFGGMKLSWHQANWLAKQLKETGEIPFAFDDKDVVVFPGCPEE